MIQPRHLSAKRLALFGVFVTALLLVACDISKSAAPAPVAATPLAGSTTVFVQFEGPWAFAPDPKDANRVIAIAPKTSGHRDLFVKASNDQTLASGIYDLSLPASGAGAGTLDPGIVQAQISGANLQQAIDAKSVRYVLRLPKPEAYVAAGRAESRVGNTYPPPATSQDSHVSAVSLRYQVSSLTGFTLSGTPDAGTLNPVLLKVETPLLRVVIEPDQMDDPLDRCDTHSRTSFRDLVKLLRLTLYVDFPDYSATCQKSDAQRADKLVPRAPLGRPVPTVTAGLLVGNGSAAGLVGGGPVSNWLRSSAAYVGHRLMGAAYFFARPAADCKAPIIVLHF
jgi:hypothetical protein